MKIPKEAVIQGFLDTVLVIHPGEVYRKALSLAREAEYQRGQEALTRSIQYMNAVAESWSDDDFEAAQAAYQEYRRRSRRADKRWHQMMDSYKL